MKMWMKRNKMRMIGKNSLMKNNITRNKSGMSREVKQFVSFDVIWITNKEVRLSQEIKLRTISSKGRYKTQATKHTEMGKLTCQGRKLTN
jgi:hypothetical protein